MDSTKTFKEQTKFDNQPTMLHGAPLIHLPRLVQKYELWSCPFLYAETTKNSHLHSLKLDNGSLVLNDSIKIPNLVFNTRGVSWDMKEDDVSTTGSLSFSDDYLSLNGSILLQTAESPKASLHSVAGTIPGSSYTTKISTTPLPPDQTVTKTTRADTDLRGVTFGFSSKKPDSSTTPGVPTVTFYIDGVDVLANYGFRVKPTLNDSGAMQLYINLELFPDAAEKVYGEEGNRTKYFTQNNFPYEANITLNLLGEEFDSGYMRKYQMEKNEFGPSQEKYGWYSDSFKPFVELASDGVETLSSEKVKRSHNPEAMSFLTTDLPRAEERVTDALNADEKWDPSWDSHISKLLQFNTDTYQLNTGSQQVLVENMKYVLSQKRADWLQQFFNDNDQAFKSFPQERIDKVMKDQAFYMKFATAYLASGMSKTNSESQPLKKLNKDEEDKLEYFLSQGMSQYKEDVTGSPNPRFPYAEQTAVIQRQTLIDMNPGLKDYFNDGKTWADRLYIFLTSQTQTDLLAMSLAQSDTKNLTKYSTLLSVLDPASDGKATAYLEYVHMNLHFDLLPHCVIQGGPDYRDLLNDVIKEYIKKYYVDGFDPKDKNATLEAMQAYTLHELQLKFGGTLELANFVNTLFLKSDLASLDGQLTTLMSSIDAQFPKLAKAGRVLSTIAWSVSTCMSLMMFSNWGNLTTVQRIQLVNVAVGTAANIALNVTEKMVDKFASKDVLFTLKNQVRFRNQWYMNFRELADLKPRQAFYISQERIAEMDARIIARSFRATTWWVKGLKILTVGVSIIGTALSWVTFVDSLSNGSLGDKVFNGLMASVATLETVAVFSALVFDSAFMASCSVGLAWVGIALVAAYFIWDTWFREKGPTPVEQFFDSNEYKDLLKSVTVPEGWTSKSIDMSKKQVKMVTE